jgi:hypothetical protein
MLWGVMYRVGIFPYEPNFAALTSEDEGIAEVLLVSVREKNLPLKPL